MLARGIVGTRGDVPFVASPMHKHAFDLRTGRCLDDAHVRRCRRTTSGWSTGSCSWGTGRPSRRDAGQETRMTAGPLDGFLVGVTAARKVDEQVALLERRGARVEWAPALSLDPNHVDDDELRAATVRRAGPARRPVPGDDRHRHEGVVRGRRALGHPARPARRARVRRDPRPRSEERRRPAPAGAARAVGSRVGVLRGRPHPPAGARPRRPADRRAGARAVALDGGARAAAPGRGRDRGDRLPGAGRRGPRRRCSGWST